MVSRDIGRLESVVERDNSGEGMTPKTPRTREGHNFLNTRPKIQVKSLLTSTQRVNVERIVAY